MQTEDDPVYREQALNQYMKAYKDCLKEEEIEERDRKEQTLKANNAKVVTGQTDAPDYTGIGCPEIAPPGIIPSSKMRQETNDSLELEEVNSSEENGPTMESQNKKVDILRSTKDIEIDEQINSSQTEKSKIVVELEDSKNNLKELESKLAAINQIYCDLKK
jgi:hypothetical protein